MQIGVVQMPNTVATQVTNIQMKISECESSTRENSFKKKKVKGFPAAVPILDSNRTTENALNDEKLNRTGARLQTSPRKSWA